MKGRTIHHLCGVLLGGAVSSVFCITSILHHLYGVVCVAELRDHRSFCRVLYITYPMFIRRLDV